jgi:hypothetical protein
MRLSITLTPLLAACAGYVPPHSPAANEAKPVATAVPLPKPQSESRPNPEKRKACAAGDFSACETLDRECREDADRCALFGSQLPAYRWVRTRSPIWNDDIGLDATVEEGARVVAVSRVGDQVRIAVPQFPVYQPNASMVNGILPSAVLQDRVLPLGPPGPHRGIVVENHEAELVTQRDGKRWTFELQCGVAEVLDQVQKPGASEVWQQISQTREGIELRGWTNEPIDRSWGGHVCGARAVTMRPDMHEPFEHGFFAGQALLKTVHWLRPSEPDSDAIDRAAFERIDEAPVPEGFEQVKPELIRSAMRDLKRGARLYSIEAIEEGRCVERVVSQNKLRYRYEETGVSGARTRVEVEYSVGLGSEGRIDLDGPVVRRWAQGRHSGIAYACSSWLRVVGVDDTGLQLVAGSFPVVSYHPDDVARWYRTREACETALAKHPRLPLAELDRLPSSTRLAQAGVRVTGGC